MTVTLDASFPIMPQTLCPTVRVVLRNCGPIDPDRVALSGRGSWDIAEHLHPSLLLPFLEPKTLQTFVPPPAAGPSF